MTIIICISSQKRHKFVKIRLILLRYSIDRSLVICIFKCVFLNKEQRIIDSCKIYIVGERGYLQRWRPMQKDLHKR